MNKDSWIYKNYKAPFTESDLNGILVAFDESRNNAILHQQVFALKEDLGFDSRVVVAKDTMPVIYSAAKKAFEEGYEHFSILADPNQVSFIENNLKRVFGNYFESITVIPEHGFRYREADMLDTLLDRGTAEQQQATQGAFADKETRTTASVPYYLIFMKANPPTKGFGKLLSTAIEYFEKQGQEYRIVLHQAGEKGAIINATERSKLLVGPGCTPMYGDNGISGTKIPSKYFGKQNRFIIPLAKGAGVIAALQEEGITNIAGVVAPQQAIPFVTNALQGVEIPGGISPISGQDVDTPSKAQLFETAVQIYEATRHSDEEDAKKNAEVTDNEKAAEEERLEAMTASDQYALVMIKFLYRATQDENAILDDDFKLWDMLSEGDKAVLQNIANESGAQEAKEVMDNLGKLVGLNQEEESEEEEDNEAAEARQAMKEALGFDPYMARTHKLYETFKNSFDF